MNRRFILLVLTGICLSCFVLLSGVEGYSQISGWHWVNPLPQGNVIHQVHFYDGQSGFAVGGFGIILRTENGGITWENIPSPTDEELFSISVVSPQLFYIAGDHACFRCTDGEGMHWTKVGTPQMESELMNAVIFFSQDKGLVSTNKGNVFKTTDGGENWTPIMVGFPNNNYPVAIEQFTDSVTGYARYMFGTFFKTTDGGNNWNAWGIGTQWDIRAMRFFDSQTGCAATLNGIRRTTDGGVNWQDVNPETRVVAFSVAGNMIGYAVTDAGRILKSQDGGLSWNLISTLPAQLTAVAFSDINHGCVAGESGTIFTTNDGGVNWELRSSGSTDTIWSVSFPVPATGYAGGDHEIQKSTDYGNSWKTVYQSTGKSFMKIRFFSETSGNAVVYDPTGHNPPSLGITDDGGNTWSFSSVTNGNIVFWPDISSLPDLNTCYIGSSASGSSAGILMTTNRGASWNHLSLPINNFQNNYDMQFLTRANGLLAETSSSGTNLYTTSDEGKNWRISHSDVSGRRIDKIFFLDTLHGYLVGSALRTNGQEGSWVARTDDGGISWTTVIEPDSAVSDYYSDISFLNHDTGYISGNRFDFRNKGLILKTMDGGNTWVRQIHRSKGKLKSIAIIDETTAFAAGEGGTILTTNTGGDFLFTPDLVPGNQLSVSVFPNPCENEVRIKIKTPVTGKCQLEIFSFDGRLMKVNPETLYEPDGLTIHFRVSALMPGTCFYRLTTNHLVITGKFIRVSQ